ncbi:hypothetical protein JOD50_000395 [Pseudoglutamicibacter cumminsii]|nr:hypothetical protein [Pseudoglutamicibacter cumminsii]
MNDYLAYEIFFYGAIGVAGLGMLSFAIGTVRYLFRGQK